MSEAFLSPMVPDSLVWAVVLSAPAVIAVVCIGLSKLMERGKKKNDAQ